jgi:hypothetical protein
VAPGAVDGALAGPGCSAAEGDRPDDGPAFGVCAESALVPVVGEAVARPGWAAAAGADAVGAETGDTAGGLTAGGFAAGADTEGADGCGLEAGGTVTDGVFTSGVLTGGVVTGGTVAAGVGTDGVVTDGTVTDGTCTDGTVTDGTGTGTLGAETVGVGRSTDPGPGSAASARSGGPALRSVATATTAAGATKRWRNQTPVIESLRSGSVDR